MGSGRGWPFGTSQKAVCTVRRRLCDMEKGLHLPPHRGDRRCIDSLAQQVEHIPFKDGVLGSSPRRITGVQMNKKAKAFHSWTDPQWKAFFRVWGGYLVVSLAILEELTEELGLGLLVFGELLDGEDLLETLDVFLL